jgi:hypothetical protein
MSDSKSIPSSGEEELTHEVLDQWEAELDEFSARITHRLAQIRGSGSQSIHSERVAEGQHEAEMDLLNTLRALNTPRTE